MCIGLQLGMQKACHVDRDPLTNSACLPRLCSSIAGVKKCSVALLQETAEVRLFAARSDMK